MSAAVPYTLCPATGKRSYASRAAARRAMARLHGRLRLYRCPECRAWHGTKQVKDWMREQ